MEKENKEKYDLDSYFVSEAHKLIFALLFTDKKIRMELLGIEEELYLNEEKAKEWHHRIAKIIHPDTCTIEGCEKAIMKLNELYSGMVKADE